MLWNDPARPQLANGRGAWRDAPMIALPRVSFEPDGAAGFTAEVILPLANRPDGFESVYRHGMKIEDVLAMLVELADDPELAVVKWFGRSPPRQGPREGRVLDFGSGEKGVVEL